LPADPWLENQQAFSHIVTAAVSAAGGVFGSLCAAAAGLRRDPFTPRVIRCAIIIAGILGLVLLEISLLAWGGGQPSGIWQAFALAGAACIFYTSWLADWTHLVDRIARRMSNGSPNAAAYVVIAFGLMLGILWTLLGLLVLPSPQLLAIYPGPTADGLLLLLAGAILGAFLLHRLGP